MIFSLVYQSVKNKILLMKCLFCIHEYNTLIKMFEFDQKQRKL